MTSGTVLELTHDTFSSTLDKNPFTIVDFWAPWCGPCRSFAPVFSAAAEKHPDVVFAKVNTEAEQQLAAEFNIRSIPTLMIFRDNIIIFSQPGALPASALEQLLVKSKELDMEEVRKAVAAQAATEAKPDDTAT